MTCQQIGLKVKSKKEMYLLLASDGQIYLPPQKKLIISILEGYLQAKRN